MKSMDDKGYLNQASQKDISRLVVANFDFHKGNGVVTRTTLGKPTPSKWDDAQKWLVNLSRGGGERNQFKTEPRNSNSDDRRLIVPVLKKEYSSGEDEEGNGTLIYYGMETKKVDCDDSMWRRNEQSGNAMAIARSICVRDMGTEMTPIASQEPSRTATPIRNTPNARSPLASGSSTPIRGPNGVQSTNAAENRSSDQNSNTLETRAVAWDEAERAKYMARYKREEMKIEAWENHQKRKAEMEMKRLEAKAERVTTRAKEKYTNKLTSARRIAEEKRAKAEAILSENAVKTSERADYIRRTGHLPSSFSIKLPTCCW